MSLALRPYLLLIKIKPEVDKLGFVCIFIAPFLAFPDT